MDELSFQGYLLETNCGFDNQIFESPISTPQYEPSQYVPFMRSADLNIGSYNQYYEEEIESVSENPLLLYPGMEEHVIKTTESVIQSKNFQHEDGEMGRTWLIGTSCPVKYRLMLAIGYLQQYVEEKDVLIQIWVPINRGGTFVLTTTDQPYTLNPNSEGLASYRNVSKNYSFPAEADSKEAAGLPGRVFLGKLPEWTPDVRFFKSDECPRINYANLYSISGCLALPVFERGGGPCLAVIEIVTTTQNVSFRLEVENISRALQAVDLESFQDFCPHGLKACNEIYQVAVPEIADILESVCKTFRLPLALTWTLCVPQGRTGYEQFDKNHDSCISTVNSACFLTDVDFEGFYIACSEQYLFLDQGIVGKAFSRKSQFFSADITSLCKANYPLSHHARMFNLRAAVAIPLQNIHTGLIEFVLELFLPIDCQDIEEQKQKWDLLAVVIKQACHSSHVIMDKEVEGDVNEQASSDERDNEEETQKTRSSRESSPEEASFIPLTMEGRASESVSISWECPKQEAWEEFEPTNYRDNDELDLYQRQEFSEFGQIQQNLGQKVSFEGREDSLASLGCSLGSRKVGKKKTKTEKTISLQVLRQYFAENLKDAAKSIGVCPTTLKRICRQHGITRWPSRKIKKVSHSLKKLQHVVDSVQGAKGLIQIGSIYTSFPELSSPKFSGNNSPCSSFKNTDSTKKVNPQADSLFRTDGTDSKFQSSSSSQNHGSGLSYSTVGQQCTNTINGMQNEYSLLVEDPVAVLKRTYSEAGLHYLNEEPMLLGRTQQQNTLKAEHPILGTQVTPPSMPKSNSQNSQDGSAFRIKTTFGDENIRFSMQPNWSFNDLQLEIAKRFNIDDFSRIDLKYLDNDQDTVVLACDADLEECKELFRLSVSQTIRISLHQTSQPQIGSSSSSSGLI